jgi:hypothetical protein
MLRSAAAHAAEPARSAATHAAETARRGGAGFVNAGYGHK